MNLDLTPVIPQTFDVAHIGLAGIAFLFLLIAVFRKPAAKEAPAAAENEQDDDVTEVTQVVEETPEPAPELKQATVDSALQLLGLFQQESRLIDFLQEDLGGFSDADIGAAARVVHEGGQKVISEYVSLEPVRAEDEESRVTINAGFDAQAVRLTGNVVGEAPYTGTLVHKGWRVNELRLPKLSEGHDAGIIAAAEVEL